MSKKTLVYFVDGPNGAGKDYFIERLLVMLRGTGIGAGAKIELLRATDFFDNKDTASERRKYVRYDTEESKTTSIMIGHLKLLERVAELTRAQTDLVIVNRSFLSTLAYNLYKQSQLADRRFYLDIFVDFLARYLRQNLEITFINMIVNPDDLKIRQLMREEGKPIDEAWNAQLIDNYHKASIELQNKGAEVLYKRSEDYESVLDEIKRRLVSNFNVY